MKKYLVVCAALLFTLPSSLLYSQEADGKSGFNADFSVIARLDGGYNHHMKSGFDDYFDLGNSSIYTSFEGNITPHLSFYLENHWASFNLNSDGSWSREAYEYLYTGIGKTADVNWLNCITFQYDLGNWFLNAGKDMVILEGLEGEISDWDINPMMASTIWTNFAGYQYQAKLGWNNESTCIAAQISTSPLNETPFGGNKFNCALQWLGDYGIFHNNWSITAMAMHEGYKPIVCFGQSVTLGDFTIAADYWNTVADEELYFLNGHSGYLSVFWNPSEKWFVHARGGIEASRLNDEDNACTPSYMAGCMVEFTPVENLRIHAYLSANQMLGQAYYAGLGIKYNLNFHIGR